MEFSNIRVSKEFETTRNGEEKHGGIADAYFHVYSKGKAIYGKGYFGDMDVDVIKVYSILFIF
jgi:hypothetical protein